MKILLIEDDRLLSQGLTQALEEDGYLVEVSADGYEADRRLSNPNYDLVILDLGIPGIDGLDVLRNARKRGNNVPILILSARDSVQNRVEGLNLGANDYLTKPFELIELEARVKALLRKEAWSNLTEVSYGNLRFDTTSRTVSIGDDVVRLTARELAVMELLLKKIGRVVSKNQVLDELVTIESEMSANALDILVHRLRKKLADSGCSIETIRGLGYIMQKH
jgi:two-component system OmpR family response regulator